MNDIKREIIKLVEGIHNERCLHIIRAFLMGFVKKL